MPNPIRILTPLHGGELIGQFDSLLLDPLELGAHRLGQSSRARQRPHHHHEVVDQPVVVEVQEVTPSGNRGLAFDELGWPEPSSISTPFLSSARARYAFLGTVP